MPRLSFEDLTPGLSHVYGPRPVSRDDIVAFARAFDRQPFHLDEEAARNSFVGELIASGWHSCALLMRLLADGFILNSTCLGSPGIEEVQWRRPVRPGDTLRARATVLDSRPSRSRPELGLVRFRSELVNQLDETVLVQTNWILFGRRGAEIPLLPEVAGRSPPEALDRDEAGSSPAPQAIPFLDDLAVGAMQELGTEAFPADEIVRFALAFDPQPFHVDAEAAQRSLFGGLCASGWHTAAAWMKQRMAHDARIRAEAARIGLPSAQLGPSPGFTDLKWLKPVYAGDRVTYRTTVVDKRVSASRPGWGLAFHHNTGHNQHGERVFEFRSAVFWERAPG